MDFVYKIVERLFVPLYQVDKRLYCPLRIFLIDYATLERMMVRQERMDLRSSTASTVLMRSLMKVCMSFNESAMLAAR
jgi:hypothetical protein